MGFDLCMAPNLKWPWAKFSLGGKSNKYCLIVLLLFMIIVVVFCPRWCYRCCCCFCCCGGGGSDGGDNGDAGRGASCYYYVPDHIDFIRINIRQVKVRCFLSVTISNWSFSSSHIYLSYIICVFYQRHFIYSTVFRRLKFNSR